MEIPGILFSATQAGIKEKGLDLGLVFFEKEMECLSAYTKNRIKAAHIFYNKKVERNPIKALLVFSGCANAFTGNEGIKDLLFLAQKLSDLLGIKKTSILFAATGVIGRRLPLKKIVDVLPYLIGQLSEKHVHKFAEAMMTTDTYPKVAFSETEGYRFLGVAKGAGMINPLFATMLSFIWTDLPLFRKEGEKIFRQAVKESFEKISVDGELSTNDTVLFFFRKGEEVPKVLENTLPSLMKSLSLMVVKDGEGATKIVHIIIQGAKRDIDAERIARRIARSPLVKTALFGCDPNIGRIVSAMGDAGVRFDPQRIEIEIEGRKVAKRGKEVPFNEEEMGEMLKKREIEITINLREGHKSFDLFTTDLSYDYVKINASYRT